MNLPLEETKSPQRWIFFVLIAGLVAITVLFIASRVFQYSGPELLNSPYSVETRLRPFEIGTSQFNVPENVIRRPEQREKQHLNQLDLIFMWPEMEGFRLDNQVAFNDVTEKSRLIFATINKTDQSIASSKRLHTIYSEHFSGDPIEGPDKLIGFAMSQASSFAGEIIYFKPDEVEPFVARCITPVEKTPTFCIRDVPLNDTIQLSYRFRLHLLKDWRAMDATVIATLEGYLVE